MSTIQSAEHPGAPGQPFPVTVSTCGCGKPDCPGRGVYLLQFLGVNVILREAAAEHYAAREAAAGVEAAAQPYMEQGLEMIVAGWNQAKATGQVPPETPLSAARLTAEITQPAGPLS